MRQLIFHHREHLNCASFELRDQCLRVERIVLQRIRGFGKVLEDEHYARRRHLGHGAVENNLAAA